MSATNFEARPTCVYGPKDNEPTLRTLAKSLLHVFAVTCANVGAQGPSGAVLLSLGNGLDASSNISVRLAFFRQWFETMKYPVRFCFRTSWLGCGNTAA